MPEIAGRLHAGCAQHRSDRAVLAAHSMGGVLAVSSTRPARERRRARGSSSTGSRCSRSASSCARSSAGCCPNCSVRTVLGIQPRARARGCGRRSVERGLRRAQGNAPRRRAHAVGRDAGVGRLGGTLVERRDGCRHPVRWVSLWRRERLPRLPRMSTVTRGRRRWHNDVDRYAESSTRPATWSRSAPTASTTASKSYDDAVCASSPASARTPSP